MAWIQNGPVSVPSRSIAAFASVAIIVAGLAGLGLGFSAGWRGGAQTTRGSIDQNQDIDQAVDAKPLVTLIAPTAPPPVNTAAQTQTDDSSDDGDSNDIAAKTAAAQAVQSKPAEKPANIDDILASPSEKPQAPAKPTTDEQAPPAKSDVPF